MLSHSICIFVKSFLLPAVHLNVKMTYHVSMALVNFLHVHVNEEHSAVLHVPYIDKILVGMRLSAAPPALNGTAAQRQMAPKNLAWRFYDDFWLRSGILKYWRTRNPSPCPSTLHVLSPKESIWPLFTKMKPHP